MKTSNIVAIVSSAFLLAAGAVHAEDTFKISTYNQSFMAKRPYQAVIANSVQQKDLQWEGATLIANPADEANLNHQRNLRVNMLSKRAY